MLTIRLIKRTSASAISITENAHFRLLVQAMLVTTASATGKVKSLPVDLNIIGIICNLHIIDLTVRRPSIRAANHGLEDIGTWLGRETTGTEGPRARGSAGNAAGSRDAASPRELDAERAIRCGVGVEFVVEVDGVIQSLADVECLLQCEGRCALGGA